MYQYPYLEQFYKDNYLKLLDWNSPLRPSKSCPKNGAAGVAKFKDYYIKTKVMSFSEDDVHSILNDETIEDGDTIFHQNLRVMRELNFVRQSDGSDTKYYFTEQFLSFVESKHTIDCYIIEQLMSIGSVDDLTMYFNFLICVMREAAIFGQVIQYRDAAAKFFLDVPNEEKRKEHQERIFRVYGFKGDQARGVTDNYTPNISYFCHAVLRQLGILTKSDVKIDNMGTLVLTPLGEMILKRIEENLQFGKQEQHSSNHVSRYKMALDLPLQQIFYGAPGTGKSYKVDEKTNENNRIRTTFHPDYDYATFVGCYKPKVKVVDKVGLFGKDTVALKHEDNTPIKEEVIVYKFVPQSFTKAYVEAWRRFANPECTDKNYYLVIEEINRGNCAQIFGDLFQLLDRTRDGYSSYAVEADTDLQQFLATDNKWKLNITLTEDIKNDDRVIAKAADVMSGKVLVLPPNFHIWATMNTSDQSLFPIDSAFKRRWDWKYVPIKYKNTNWEVVLSDKYWCYWTELQTKLNDLIYDATESEDKMLGDWFVIANDKGEVTEEQLVGKIIFYLWNDVAKVDAGTLFDLEVEKRGRNKSMTFSDFYKMDGKTDTAIVKDWLTKIGVAINEPIDEGKEEEDGGSEDGASAGTFPIIVDGKQYDLKAKGDFKKILSYIGWEKVYDLHLFYTDTGKGQQFEFLRLADDEEMGAKVGDHYKSVQHSFEDSGKTYHLNIDMRCDRKAEIITKICKHYGIPCTLPGE